MIFWILFTLFYSYLFSLTGNLKNMYSVSFIPGYVFGIVWTILYILYGILLSKLETRQQIIGIIVLTLTNLWTPISVYTNLKISKIYILFVLGLNIWFYSYLSKEMRPYLIPQILWILFASTLLLKMI